MKKILSSQINFEQKQKINLRVSRAFKLWLQEKKEQEGFKSMNDLMVSLLTNTPLIVTVLGDEVIQSRIEKLNGDVEILRENGISFNKQMKLFFRYPSLSNNMMSYVKEIVSSMKTLTLNFCNGAEQIVNSIIMENKPSNDSLISANSFKGNPNENLSELITIYINPEIIFDLSRANKDFLLESTHCILRTKLANDTRDRMYKSSYIITLKSIIENFAWQLNMILKNYHMLLDNAFFDHKEEVKKTCSSSIDDVITMFKALQLKFDLNKF